MKHDGVSPALQAKIDMGVATHLMNSADTFIRLEAGDSLGAWLPLAIKSKVFKYINDCVSGGWSGANLYDYMYAAIIFFIFNDIPKTGIIDGTPCLEVPQDVIDKLDLAPIPPYTAWPRMPKFKSAHVAAPPASVKKGGSGKMRRDESSETTKQRPVFSPTALPMGAHSSMVAQALAASFMTPSAGSSPKGR